MRTIGVRRGIVVTAACGGVAVGVLGGGVAGEASGVAARASAGPCKNPTAQPPNVAYGPNNGLSAVAVTGCRAWAVGWRFKFDSYLGLIERWNGTAWKLKATPNGALSDVAATSSTNAWAVGSSGESSVPRSPQSTVVVHWDGSVWGVQKSPNPAGPNHINELGGVAATSSTNAWAVGSYYNGTAWHALIVHWNGAAWKVQPSPSPGGRSASLSSVAATSPTDAWAVGDYANGSRTRTLIEHWDGTSWKVQSSATAKGSTQNYLDGVAATSPTNAWAVGYYYRPGGSARTLVLHWNGTAWKLKPSPNAPRESNNLYDVAAISPTNAWAVGSSLYYKGGLRVIEHCLIEHWNGTHWKLKPSPVSKGPFNYLNGVAATSRTNVWAVGGYYIKPRTGQRNLALHWNGTTWTP